MTHAIFQRQIDLNRSQRDAWRSRCSWTPVATRQAQPWGVQQVPVMIIKI